MKSFFTFILLLVITFPSAHAQKDGAYSMSSQKLEVRSGPGLNFNTIAEVPQGTQVYVMSTSYGDWSAIQHRSLNGFVITKHLTEDSRIADAERAAKEAAAKREAAKLAAKQAIARAEAAKRAAEEAARKAIAEAERLKREAEATAVKAIADADAARKSKDAAARRALADTEETRKALEEANRRAAKGGNITSSPIESTTASGGSNSKSSPKSASISVERENKYAAWEKKTYKSGATPKSFNFKGKFDYKLDNYLKIKVGKNTEVVVKLYKLGKTKKDDQLSRVTYINSGSTQFIRNIPEGEYYLKIAYGHDWREYRGSDGKIEGEFTKNALYEKNEQILNYNTAKTSKGTNVPSYNLALDLLPSGSGKYNTSNDEEQISKNDFNN